MDMARLLFTERHDLSEGEKAHYLFEPLLQQAILHQTVMLMHAGLFSTMDLPAEAQVHVARAKENYDEYRQRLTEMQTKLIDRRLAQVEPLKCRQKLEKKEQRGGWGINLEVSYEWNDRLREDDDGDRAWAAYTAGRYNWYSVEVSRPGKQSTSPPSCEWSGNFSDGRHMIEESRAYSDALRKSYVQYTNDLLSVLDAPWRELASQCLDGFEVHSEEDSSGCHPSSDADLGEKLKAHFGVLHETGVWPSAQHPVMSASDYKICERVPDADARSTPRGSKLVCLKQD